MSKSLVIVESPSKIKTITKILGNDFIVMASYGHVADLPKSEIGFDPDNNYKPSYKVTPDKRNVVSNLRREIYKDTSVYLAADDDNEGEAIAWHLARVLKLNPSNTKRVVFHEITKPAVLDAFKHPTNININRVNTQQCRRIIDRAVGYKLSPLLWRKIKGGLSAGRVQSVALRIVVDRENEIDAFIPEEFWKIRMLVNGKSPYKADYVKLNNKTHKPTTEEEATTIKNNTEANPVIIGDVIERKVKRTPPPPLITSSLQQAANTAYHFPVKHTMFVAQKLYEGNVNIPNHTGGLITYMRTDSLYLSTTATSAIHAYVSKVHGNKYTIAKPRVYGKVKNAQEAHEAIRPTNINLTPEAIRSHVDIDLYKLYKLIWERTVASQMTEASIAITTVSILAGKDKEYTYEAKGTKILFDGYLAVYNNSKKNETILPPNITKGAKITDTTITTEQFFTKPPSRYSEATLVKKLEEVGVGRPSTYASTISTIIDRRYVEYTDDKKLQPTIIGGVVIKYLKEAFPNIVDPAFTANLEKDLDKISAGTKDWVAVIDEFYKPFINTINTQSKDTERVQYSDAVELGKDKKSGLMVYVKTGQYGAYVQLGEKTKEFKPKIASIDKGIDVKSITLEQAMKLLEFPKNLGTTKDGKFDVAIYKGKFGPYIKINKAFYNIDTEVVDINTLTLKGALAIVDAIDAERAKAMIASFPKDNIYIIDGRYGPYIKYGKKNFKLPKTLTRDEMSKLDVMAIKSIISKQPKNNRKGRRR